METLEVMVWSPLLSFYCIVDGKKKEWSRQYVISNLRGIDITKYVNN